MLWLFLLLAAADNDIADLSLEDLLNPKTAVATKTVQDVRDAPSVITVLTRDDIRLSGAKYLLDVLALVPGFAPGIDVEGVVDVGFRGEWGHEGKILLLIDGMEANELLFSTLQLGNHYPVEQIERVEIIRGPGSAVYGGFAELAVINIVSRSAKDLSGLSAAVSYGEMARGFGNAYGNLSYGEEVKAVPGLALSLQTFFGAGNRSDFDYVDQSGASFGMGHRSELQTLMVNFAATYKDTRLHVLVDNHTIQTQDGFGAVEPSALSPRFLSVLADARSDFHIGDKLTLTPRLFYKYQAPWQLDDANSDLSYDQRVHQALAGLQVNADPLSWLDIVAGVEGYWQYAFLGRNDLGGSQTLFFGDKTHANFENLATFAQLLFKTFIVNVTAGARFEYHSQFGASFVPRLALTKTFGRFHFKALFSQAFRAPSIEDLSLNPAVVPERTNVLEGELGYDITDNMQLTVNGFWNRIDRPIIYDVVPGTSEQNYVNSTRTGTFGVEAEFRLKYKWGFATLNYSFYSSAGLAQPDTYAVPGHADVLLGFPAHKLALNTSFCLYGDHLFVSPTFIFMSERYAYTSADSDGNPVIARLPPVFLIGATIYWRRLFVPGLDVGVGVSNLLDQASSAPQPYNGGHAPLPLASREFFVRLSYEWKR